MDTRRWLNPSLPQTLQICVILLYFRAVFMLLFGLDLQVRAVFPVDELLRVVLPAALAAGAFGMANKQRWGYYLAIVGAAIPLLARLLLGFGIGFDGDIPAVSPLDYDVLGLLFEGALLVLLLHPQSREYQKIWFE
ncbi:hypothetical protein BH20ACT2_BH20ACT2_06570 [soil metagenome]